MYRDFGCTPDPSLAQTGVYDLIAGRPYLNLSREPRMQFGGLPFGYSFAQLKANLRDTTEARAGFLRENVGLGTLLRLPGMMWKLRRMNKQIAFEALTFAERFQVEILPAFRRECDSEAQTDYATLTTPELLARFEHWSERVLGEFARHSLKPAALADRALDDWRQSRGSEWVSGFASSLLADLELDPAVDVAAGLHQVASGAIQFAEFLKGFGHRGPREMELNQPRYCETKSYESVFTARPIARGEDVEKARVLGRTLPVERLRDLVRLREFAKHYFMLGYFQLRRMLLELDRRFDLNGGIFFFTPEELRDLTLEAPPRVVIADRRRRWAVLKSVPAPPILFSDDLSGIGRSPGKVPEMTQFHGLGISAGAAEGIALVLTEPARCYPTHPYVLVCPSNDPAWTPLLLGASAVVMETGGLLSHGAIVAREFGVPAVGEVHDATRNIRNGDRLRVDGSAGTVTVLDSSAGQIPPAAR
jgi:pyruvate,water dikinase